jgi:hypothetical protein
LTGSATCWGELGHPSSANLLLPFERKLVHVCGADGCLSREESVADVARGRRERDASRFMPDGAIEFFLVADIEPPFAVLAMKMASLILRPDILFLAVTEGVRASALAALPSSRA